MANKVKTMEEALKLIQDKPQSLDTLTSAIVRGKGLNLTENKAEFFREYAKVSEALEDNLSFALLRVVEPERYERLSAEARAKSEAEAKAEAKPEAEAEAEAEAKPKAKAKAKAKAWQLEIGVYFNSEIDPYFLT